MCVCVCASPVGAVLVEVGEGVHEVQTAVKTDQQIAGGSFQSQTRGDMDMCHGCDHGKARSVSVSVSGCVRVCA